MTTEDISVINPADAKKVILINANAGLSTFLWGAPGVGKSDLVQQLAKELSARYASDHSDPLLAGEVIPETAVPVYDVRLLLLDPTDLKGMPYRSPETNTIKWGEPEILPASQKKLDRYAELTSAQLTNMAPSDADLDTDEVKKLVASKGRCILFLDELTAAPGSVQAAAYQLVLDRKIGSYTLPEGCIIVAAGNRKSDRGIVYPMPKPLSNRFSHVEIDVDSKQWLGWAIDNKIHPTILGYVSQSGQKLYSDDFAESDNRAFCTPRSWAFMSRAIFELEKNNIALDHSSKLVGPVVNGIIGTGNAHDFMTWVLHAKDLPRASDILAGRFDKADSQVMKETSAQYYLSAAMCYELHDLYKKAQADKNMDPFYAGPVNNFFGFLNTKSFSNQEVLIMTVRVALQQYNINMKVKGCTEWKTFFNKNAVMIQKAFNAKR